MATTTAAQSGISSPISTSLSATSIAGFVALPVAFCLCALPLLYCAGIRIRDRRTPPPVPKKNYHVPVLITEPTAKQIAAPLSKPILGTPVPAFEKRSLNSWQPEGANRYKGHEPVVALDDTKDSLPTHPALLASPVHVQNPFKPTYQDSKCPRGISWYLENVRPQPLQPGRTKIESMPERRPWPGSSRGSSWYSQPSWCPTIFEEDLVVEGLERELGVSPGPTVRSVEAVVGSYTMVQPTRTHKGQCGVLSIGGANGTYDV